MAEIKCPRCGEVFQVDESDYARIVAQVRDNEFAHELHERVAAAQAGFDKDVALAVEQVRASTSRDIIERDAAIAELKAKIEAVQAQHLLEVERATAELSNKLALAQGQAAQTEAALRQQLAEQASYKDQQLRDKDAEIERILAQRARLNTKLLGESLEQHCELSFKRMRASGAFPNAEFVKDTQAVSDGEGDAATKGDYIFRELDEAGNEIVSIMFEMKTEQEDAVHHRTNESHLKKLDADRRKKGCEYAVLVSTLEPENELYNDGIVDVSYHYPKMYVVRPQFFIPIIGLLRNAGAAALSYKAQLAEVRRQDIDVTNFEAAMEQFKEGFAKNYGTASRKFFSAIEEIDKTIDHLNKVKENLISSERQLRLANDKADSLSIRKLTRDAPSVRERIEAARQTGDADPAEPALEPDRVE